MPTVLRVNRPLAQHLQVWTQRDQRVPARAVKEDLAASFAPKTSTSPLNAISARVSVAIITRSFSRERRRWQRRIHAPDTIHEAFYAALDIQRLYRAADYRGGQRPDPGRPR